MCLWSFSKISPISGNQQEWCSPEKASSLISFPSLPLDEKQHSAPNSTWHGHSIFSTTRLVARNLWSLQLCYRRHLALSDPSQRLLQFICYLLFAASSNQQVTPRSMPEGRRMRHREPVKQHDLRVSCKACLASPFSGHQALVHNTDCTWLH